MKFSAKSLLLTLVAAGTWMTFAGYAAPTCTGEVVAREATVGLIKDFVAHRQAEVLTFEGYSGSGYEDAATMLRQAARILGEQDPSTTLVNIGGTEVGIGAVYEVAKRKGFTLMGIVSTLARDEDAALSPCVDYVFFVRDSTWGGRLPDTNELSPTSQAIVEISTSFVAFGGGAVARDELLEGKRVGKPVTFVPADMNHAQARAKANRKNLPVPIDFRGAAHRALLGGG